MMCAGEAQFLKTCHGRECLSSVLKVSMSKMCPLQSSMLSADILQS